MTPTWQICLLGGLIGLGAINVLCCVVKGVHSVWSRDVSVQWGVSISRTESRTVLDPPESYNGSPGFDGLSADAVSGGNGGNGADGPIIGFDPGTDLGSHQQELVVMTLRPGIEPDELRDVFLRAYAATSRRLNFINPPQLWEQPREELHFRHLDVRQEA